MIIEENIFFESGNLMLQGVLAYDENISGGPGVVICPPHPLLGGDLENNIITAIHNRVAGEKFVSLRFNYGGVGESQGQEDKQAEKENLKAFWEDFWSPVDARRPEDATGAVNFLKGLQGVDRDTLFLVGYSFGAYAAQHAAITNPQLAGLVLIAPTVHFHDFTPLGRTTIPKLVISSDNDFSYSHEEFEKSYEKLSEPKSLKLLRGAEHFFIGHEDEISSYVTEFMLEQCARKDSRG